MVKRTYGALAAFIFSASFLNALTDGQAKISPNLVASEVIIDAKLVDMSYPLNTKVYILNTQTGKGTEAVVIDGSGDSSLTVQLSRELAEKIGIKGESGRITIFTLPEAEAFHLFSNQGGSQKTDDPQIQETLPEKPANVAAIAGISGSTPADPEAVWNPEKPVLLETSIGTEDTPQIYIPETVPTLTQGDGSLKIDERPVLEKTLITPEIYLPDKSPVLTNGNESPGIYEKPGVADMIMGPEIHLPTETPGSTKATEVPRISEAPKVNETNPAGRGSWPYNSTEYDIALVPTEKRPPTEGVAPNIPREAEIAPIPSASTARLPPESEIRPLPSNTPVPETAPRETRRDDGSVYLDPALLIPPIGSASSNAPTPTFSVPLITNLEKGKYYVQLAALSNPELVEPELSKIGRAYPLAIQNIWYREKLFHRILLGPINMGESGALLQRFKGIGYKDAFVRRGS